MSSDLQTQIKAGTVFIAAAVFLLSTACSPEVPVDSANKTSSSSEGGLNVGSGGGGTLVPFPGGGSPSPTATPPGSPGLPSPTATPAPAAGAYVVGQSYGSCLVSMNADFQKTSASTPNFPMLTCTTSAEPTCAAGFQVVHESPTQMNGSSTPGPNSYISVFYQRFRCMKLADSAGSTNYVVGAEYGSCLRQYDSSFSAVTVVHTVAPMTSCNLGKTDPVCPAGFRVTMQTPVQMNCSTNPSVSFVPCYFIEQRCAKL